MSGSCNSTHVPHDIITTFMTSFNACGYVRGLVHELQACQLFMANMFLNAHELFMISLCYYMYFIEKMFCDSLLKIKKNYILSPSGLVSIYIYIYYIPPPLAVHFPMTRSVRYQPIFNGLKFTLHCTRVLNNVVIATVIEMVENG